MLQPSSAIVSFSGKNGCEADEIQPLVGNHQCHTILLTAINEFFLSLLVSCSFMQISDNDVKMHAYDFAVTRIRREH